MPLHLYKKLFPRETKEQLIATRNKKHTTKQQQQHNWTYVK